MGYENATAQLACVPLYIGELFSCSLYDEADHLAGALCVSAGMSMLSDRRRSRGIPAATVFAISSVGWFILRVEQDSQRIRYFGAMCITSGGCASVSFYTLARLED